MKDLKGSDVEAGMAYDASGATMMTGDAIDFYRLLMIRQGLKAQAIGMKLTGRGPAATTIARRELGIKGNLASITRQVEEIINRVQEERSKVEREKLKEDE